jgi:hypothetical protein
MMFRLRSDVFVDRWNIRRTHTEGSMSLLPLKLLTFDMRPPRRIRFNRDNSLRQCQRRRNLNQQMNVVLHSANRVDENLNAFANPGGKAQSRGRKSAEIELRRFLVLKTMCTTF